MVTPDIKGYFSSDVADLDSFSPSSPESVYFPLEISVGPLGTKSSNLFQVLVATPEALRVFSRGKVCESGRHILLVYDFNWQKLKQYLEGLITQCTGDTWEEVAMKIGRFVQWEYDEYVYVEDGTEDD